MDASAPASVLQRETVISNARSSRASCGFLSGCPLACLTVTVPTKPLRATLPESNRNRVSIPILGQRAESNCTLGAAWRVRPSGPARGLVQPAAYGLPTARRMHRREMEGKEREEGAGAYTILPRLYCKSRFFYFSPFKGNFQNFICSLPFPSNSQGLLQKNWRLQSGI